MENADTHSQSAVPEVNQNSWGGGFSLTHPTATTVNLSAYGNWHALSSERLRHSSCRAQSRCARGLSVLVTRLTAALVAHNPDTALERLISNAAFAAPLFDV